MPLIEPTVHSPRGIQDNRDPADQAALAPSVRRARDGSVLWWGGVDTPGPPPIISPGVAASVTVAVSPVRPGHAITVEYRVNGGPVRQAIGQPEPRVPDVNARMFRADLPGQSGGLVEFLPVLRFAGQPISPGLAESAECSRYQVGCRAVPGRDRGLIGHAKRGTGGRASVGVEHQVPLERHDHHPQGGRRRAAGRIADQLVRRGGEVRRAEPSRGSCCPARPT